MVGLIRNKHKAFVTAFFWILRIIVHHDRMDSDLSWWMDWQTESHFGICTYNLCQNHVDMIWCKILFEVLLFSEFCCNPANMAVKCRCILSQKGFELSMMVWVIIFIFLEVLLLYTTSTFFQMLYVKSCCFILTIIDEIFWSLYLTNTSGFVGIPVYFLSIFSFKA